MNEEFRRTKIICTLGPSTDEPEVLSALAEAGMNVARLNFSHGSHDEHLVRINKVKKLREETGRAIGILLDTKGPEVRIKTFRDERVTLLEGQTFTLTGRDVEGTVDIVSLTYPKLAEDVSVGSRILIDDGLIGLTVMEIHDLDIVCRVDNGGPLSNRKSINVPGIRLNLPYLSDADKADIAFGCEQDVDFIAASFVRSAEDVKELKALLRKKKALKRVQIIAKIENREGVDNIDRIIREVDGVMVARGDMGVEIAFDELPYIQKTIIKKCVAAGKIVITATQMLDSMTSNPRPTRAEVSDVANAVYDGTTAVMLSGETSVGKYPVETVRTMNSIVWNAESNIHFTRRRHTREEFLDMALGGDRISAGIALAAVTASEDLNARVIVAISSSGKTVRAVSSFHPDKPIIGATPNEKTLHQMALYFGVVPMLTSKVQPSGSLLFHEACKAALRSKYCSAGDLIVYTAGLPVGIAKHTNTMQVHCITEDEARELG